MRYEIKMWSVETFIYFSVSFLLTLTFSVSKYLCVRENCFGVYSWNILALQDALSTFLNIIL